MIGFSYDDLDQLCCEGIALSELAERFGTPLYVYSATTILERFRAYQEAFHWAHKLLISYAVKANGHLAILKLLAREGSGAEVVSLGELKRALRAGIPGSRIVFSGVGKRPDEIKAALQVRILQFNVESAEELHQIQVMAQEQGCSAPVAFRLNLDIEAGTHPYLATGVARSQFGLEEEEARELALWTRKHPEIKVIGVHTHLGSQIMKIKPFMTAAERLLHFVKELQAVGHPISTLNLGGGLGVSYRSEDPELSPQDLAEALRPILERPLRDLNLRLILEPGRSIVAHAGVLLTRILYRKKRKDRYLIIVDAGLSELLRPALYNAYHKILPVIQREDPGQGSMSVDLVGPICESADVLGRDRSLPLLEPGELLAILDVGAYGFTMSSNYNARPRPAEVFVKGNQAWLIRPRESLECLWKGEQIPPFLEEDSP